MGTVMYAIVLVKQIGANITAKINVDLAAPEWIRRNKSYQAHGVNIPGRHDFRDTSTPRPL